MLKNKNFGIAIAFLIIIGVALYGLQYRRGRNVYDIDIPIVDAPADCEPATIRFAVLGDFGDDGQPEADVAAMVQSWDVDFVTTTGDNNYPNGAARTIDANIGQYYSNFIYPYVGEYGNGAEDENRFFPILGNHDWNTNSIQPYLDYFTLPGNERYYDIVQGPVHLFMLDSDPHEPDGIEADSIQAQWLQPRLENATAPWRIVHLHHAPYSSGAKHGDNETVQWPFAEWGATAVLSGHEHLYDRLFIDDIVYFVHGLSGRQKIYAMGDPSQGSVVRYNQDYGAMLVQATDSCINFTFYNRQEMLIDSFTMEQ